MEENENKIIPMPPRGEDGNSYYAQFLKLIKASEADAKEALEHLSCFHEKNVSDEDCKGTITSLKKLSDALEKEVHFFKVNESKELVQQVKYSALVSITYTKGHVDNVNMEIETLTWIDETDHFHEYI